MTDEIVWKWHRKLMSWIANYRSGKVYAIATSEVKDIHDKTWTAGVKLPFSMQLILDADAFSNADGAQSRAIELFNSMSRFDV